MSGENLNENHEENEDLIHQMEDHTEEDLTVHKESVSTNDKATTGKEKIFDIELKFDKNGMPILQPESGEEVETNMQNTAKESITATKKTPILKNNTTNESNIIAENFSIEDNNPQAAAIKTLIGTSKKEKIKLTLELELDLVSKDMFNILNSNFDSAKEPILNILLASIKNDEVREQILKKLSDYYGA